MKATAGVTKIKAVLKKHGHNADKVNKLKLNSHRAVVEAALELTGMTPEQYRASGGRALED